VVGIFKAKGDPAESGALVRMADFKEVSARGTYSYIEIKADNPKNMPKLIGYVNMAFEMLHDEFPDAPAIMALPEKQYWGKLAKMFKMAVMVSKAKAYVIVVCALLFLLNISHSAFQKRVKDIRIFSDGGISKALLLTGFLIEVFVVSMVAGILGGGIAMACSGMTVNLQLATVVLRIPPGAILVGLTLAIILGILGTILPIIRVTFSRHQGLSG
jgi:ABC-type antimicrobial peptide transport system permease subunit